VWTTSQSKVMWQPLTPIVTELAGLIAAKQNLAAVPTMIWRQKMAIADLRSKVNALRGNADGVRATVDRLQSSYPSPYGQLPWTSTEYVGTRGETARKNASHSHWRCVRPSPLRGC